MKGSTFFMPVVFAALSTGLLQAQSLQTTFDQRGLVSLSYNGVSLVDLNAHLGDAFYVGGFKLGGGNEWGGVGATVNWNNLNQTLTWSYHWGKVSCRFLNANSRLSLFLTVTNSSTEVLNAINIYPLGLQFPSLPKQFVDPKYAQFHDNLDGPSLIPADFGSGMLVLTNNNAKQLYVGFSPSPPTNHYALEVGTLGDGSQGFLPGCIPVNRPIAPGASDTYSISLRFAPSGTDYHTIANDVLVTYSKAWPQTPSWPDRRPIGELFMSAPTNSPISNLNPNPRNYGFVSGGTSAVDIRTPNGLAAFQAAALAYADNSVNILKLMNAQGMIVWDFEGQQYPQANPSYLGDPVDLASLSPEMNSIADQFFAKFTSQNLRCGMTLRPQHLDLSSSVPNQVNLPTSQIAGELLNKINYAYHRWGCTIFYVDSDGGPFNSTDPAVFAAVRQSAPYALVAPENIWVRDSAYTAPLASFTAPYKPLHTPADELKMWPGAFRVTYIGDAPNHDLSNNPENPNQWNEFVQAVKSGDILSFRAWFDDQPLNSQVLEIYSAAGRQQ